MARVLIIGYGPLPRAGVSQVGSASLRTRQLLKPILAAGHTVNLFTLPIPGAEGAEGESPAMLPDNYEGLAHQRFSSHNPEFAIRMVSDMARQLDPGAILGVGAIPAYVGAMLGSAAPLWADLPGHWMAETQGLCFIEQNDDRLAAAWAIERTILRRADKFSAVSRPQLYATIGELGAIGRLNQFTFDYPFGHHIPHAAFRWTAKPNEPKGGAPVLRGPIAPAEAFILLWSGTFKVSCDASLLVSVVNKLMDRYRSVHFVATGGRADKALAGVWSMFVELIDSSPHKDRCHLMGWLPSDQLSTIHREADLAIHVDARNYETLLGGRARLNTLAASGVPIVSTIGTEISEWLDDGKAILAAPMGDAEALVEAIEPWVEQREGLRGYAQRARSVMESDFGEERVARPLLEWLKHPKPAPDNKVKLERAKGQSIDPSSVTLNALEGFSRVAGLHSPEVLAEAAARLEGERQKKGFLFGLRRP